MRKRETPEGVRTHEYKVLDEFDADGFPDTALGVIELLQARLEKLPTDVPREDLLVEISMPRYDDTSPMITLACWVPRPVETVEAEAKRARWRKQDAEQRAEANERQQLKKLLAKYGVPE